MTSRAFTIGVARREPSQGADAAMAVQSIAGLLTNKRFDRQRELGRGAFGAAFLVTDTETALQYALKVIDLGSMSAKEIESAHDEVRIHAELSHPNICSYFGSYVEDKKLHLILEYCDAGDLSALVRAARDDSTPFNEGLLLNWFAQLASALYCVHARGLIHRDVKSSNVFLSRSGDGTRTIKLADFGIARVLSDKSLASTVSGTPFNMSPELVNGEPYNSKSDVWALGCVLYELATLTPAFGKGNMCAVVLSILRGAYSPLPEYYSTELHTLVERLLQLDPAVRPSMRELLLDPFVAAAAAATAEGHEEGGMRAVAAAQLALSDKDTEGGVVVAASSNGTGWGSTPRSGTAILSQSAGELTGAMASANASLTSCRLVRSASMHSAPDILSCTQVHARTAVGSRPASAGAPRIVADAASWAAFLSREGPTAGIALLRRERGAVERTAPTERVVSRDDAEATRPATPQAHAAPVAVSLDGDATLPPPQRFGIAARMRRGVGEARAHAELVHAAESLAVAARIREAIAAVSVASPTSESNSASLDLSDVTLSSFTKLTATWSAAPPPPSDDFESTLTAASQSRSMTLGARSFVGGSSDASRIDKLRATCLTSLGADAYERALSIVSDTTTKSPREPCDEPLGALAALTQEHGFALVLRLGIIAASENI